VSDATEELTSLAGTNLLILALDVRKPSTIARAVDEAISRFGRIDVLVNNAGFTLGGVFEGLSREQIKEQFDVNVFGESKLCLLYKIAGSDTNISPGVMDVTRSILPHFRSHLSDPDSVPGIINISSAAGRVGIPVASLYSASKFALEGFTEALSYELAGLPGNGVWVKSILPTSLVTSTNILSRLKVERMKSDVPKDYEAYLQAGQAGFDAVVGARSITAGDVALAVWEAAEDGRAGEVERKRKVRYYVGHDGAGIIRARNESVTDGEYMEKIRRILGLE
jgi:NAD(P)-dependent dehydrogenase (short-subunit alcohol dehydrogenase family)